MKLKQRRKLDRFAFETTKVLTTYKAEIDYYNRLNKDDVENGGFFQMPNGFTVVFIESKEEGDKLIESYKKIINK